MQADSFIVIQNIAFKYGAADGIEIRNSHHIQILDCDLSYIGGTELTTQVRYGGGIQFWAKSHDNVVNRCRLWEIYDDAVTNQGNASAGGTVQQYNLYYINNLIWNCSESSFCFYIQPDTVAGSYLHNIHFENNTCVNAGGGWAGLQRPDLKGFQIYCSENTAPIDSIFIRNNIFYKSRCVLFFDNTSKHTLSYINTDYNCWFTANTTDTIVGLWTKTAFTFWKASQFNLYQTANNEDIHSIMSNPLLLNPSNNNFHLTVNSPCIQKGINVGIPLDFDLNPRPLNGGSYDIGAYQYVNVLPVKLLSFEVQDFITYNIVNWQTANKINAAYFNIQRSTDGANFITIGSVNVKGSDSYFFKDFSPLLQSCQYYRLQIEDNDGKESYSKIVSVQNIFSNKSIVVYPNPTYNSFTIKASHIVNVKIIDNMDRIVRQIVFSDATNPCITLNSISKGLYHLYIKTIEGNTETIDILKN